MALGLGDRVVQTGEVVDLGDADGRAARAGFTNSGQPCSPAKSTIFLRAAASSRAHSRGRITRYGPTLSPKEVNTRFMYSLSWPTAEDSTPEPT